MINRRDLLLGSAASVAAVSLPARAPLFGQIMIDGGEVVPEVIFCSRAVSVIDRQKMAVGQFEKNPADPSNG